MQKQSSSADMNVVAMRRSMSGQAFMKQKRRSKYRYDSFHCIWAINRCLTESLIQFMLDMIGRRRRRQ